MVFGNRAITTELNLKIDNIEIERVYENKFLGVVLDDKICWKPHIRHVGVKIAKSIAVINKAKHILNTRSLHILYCTMILPYLTYCVEAWGNTYKTAIHPLSILQKRALRVINNTGYRDHTNILFYNSHILKFPDLIKFKTAQVMYRAKNKLLPTNIQNRFPDKEIHYDLRNPSDFEQPLARLTLKSMSVASCGMSLWSGLAEDIRKSLNINHFKRKLKNTYFDSYLQEETQSTDDC